MSERKKAAAGSARLKRACNVLAIAIVLAALLFAAPGSACRALGNDEIAAAKALIESGDVKGFIAMWEAYTGENRYQTDWEFEEALLSFPREKYLPALRAGITSRNSYIRASCTFFLADMGDKEALQIIIDIFAPKPLTEQQKKAALEIAKNLGSDDFAERLAARESLIKMGRGVVEVIEPLLKDPDLEVAHSTRDVIDSLRVDIDSRLVEAVRRFQDPDARQVLVCILKSGKYGNDLLSSALYYLSDCAAPEDAPLARKYLDGPCASAAVWFLGRLKDAESLPVFIEWLKDPAKEMLGVEGLRLMRDKRAIEPLKAGLAKATDSEKRMRYVAALAFSGDKEQIRRIIEESAEDDAIWKTGVWGAFGKDEIDMVAKRMLQIKDEALLHDLSICLSRIAERGDARAINAVRSAKTKVTSGISARFVRGPLIKLGDVEEEKAVLAELDDKDAVKRYRALEILGDVHDEKYLPLLVKALDDKAPCDLTYQRAEVRDAAIIAVAATAYFVSPPGIPTCYHGRPDNRDRRVREIKEWYKNYLEEKAAKPAQTEPPAAG